jgi:hypothetical protein
MAEQLMNNYPEALLKTYARWSANTESERLYNKYAKQVTLYLKGKADDGLERSKVTVNLYKAARELGYVKKEETKKAKAAKKLARSKRTLPKSGGDEGQTQEEIKG